MPSPSLREAQDSPFFPPPSTVRPSLPATNSGEGGSDSSIDTLSSVQTEDLYSSNETPYSRLVMVENSGLGAGVVVGKRGGKWDVGSGLGEEGGSRSMPPHNSRAPAEERSKYPSPTSTFVAPSPSTSAAASSNSSSQRHQSLPTLITSQPTPKASTSGIRSSAPPPPPAATYNLSQALSLTPESSPLLASAAFSTSPNFYAPFPQTSPPAPGVTSSMTRSHSSTPSLSHLPSPTSHRPGSSGTFSSATTSGSTSSRPWVRDSDASSVCSGGSCWSEKGVGGAEGHEHEHAEEDGGEVLKVAGEGVEFLDPRPEPKGASLSINRSDPHVVVLHVTLPGFSLDNITVAMRRGHKVHIVADSYGAEGGHFEKLVSLGSGVSSAAPRAEFDGRELKVYVQRRAMRAGSTTPSLTSSEDATSPPISPPFTPSSTPSSPSSSSIDSLSLANSNTSPVPPPAASFVSSPSEPPIVTRSTAEPHQRKSSKSLTGPEGAKAAAKKAREEAASRAREEAKALPKVGRRVVLSRDGGAARAFGAKEKEKAEEEERPLAQPLAVPPERNGTIKARSPSPAAISPTSTVDSTSTSSSTSSSDDSLATRSDASSYTSASSLEPSTPASTSTSISPSRPKFRPSNLTLRPGDRTSFREASLADEGSPNPSDGGGSGGGSATPKVERSVSTWGFSAAGGTTPKGRRTENGEGGIGEAL